MKKRGPICNRCGVMIPVKEAVVIRVGTSLVWVHKQLDMCGT